MAKELVGKIPPELKAYRELSSFFESLELSSVVHTRHKADGTEVSFYKRSDDQLVVDVTKGEQHTHFRISEKGLESLEMHNVPGPKIIVKIGNNVIAERNHNYPDTIIYSAINETTAEPLRKSTKPMVDWVKALASGDDDSYIPSPISIYFK